MDQPGAGIVPGKPGTAIFTGGGWLQRGPVQGDGATAGGADARPGPGAPRGAADLPGRGTGSLGPNEAVILSDPSRIVVAHSADEVPSLLDEIGSEQASGCFVAAYVTYEAGEAFGLTVKQPEDSQALPSAWMAVYPEDSVRQLSPPEWARLLKAVDVSRVARFVGAALPELSVSRQEFVQAIDCIRELIAAGDTYQVNYTVRAGFKVDLDPLDYFLAMVLRQPVPYAAFLDLGDAQVLSLSPELFLRRRLAHVESMPMKGTRPRSDSPAEDIDLAYELLRSEKDRAENLMIVDMVRNDLGRVSRAGSINVPALFAVEPYRTVWQMVSTVTGRVRRNATVREIMAATFPGASITGAPKHHTMEIISRVETEPRGVYTGTVGLFLPGGDFTCNLAIRTLVHRHRSFRLGVGAGIVWDSDPGEEFEETLTKATFALPRVGSRWEPMTAAERLRAASIALFETMLLEGETESRVAKRPPGKPAGLARYRYLGEHLDRLAASAAVLGLPFDRAAAEQRLSEFAEITGRSVVLRLELGVNGEMSLISRPVPEPARAPIALMVSPFRTDPYDPLLAHKTTSRHLYDRERERARSRGCREALFMNQLGRITEGAVTNVFARYGDSWLTPPVEDGLLPGIWRADFLRETKGLVRSLTLEDLLRADEIAIGNSVRGKIRVDSLSINCPAW